jgi:hypothetical protein
MLNQRGQEFAGFRLLIDAILVLLILVIVIGIMGWVTSLRFQISEKRLFDGFLKAINSPNGKTILEKEIVLQKGTIYGAAAFQRPSVPKNCIEFDALGLTSLELSNNNRQIEIKEDVQLDVYYRCQRQFEADCDVLCEISFGKEFEEE